MEVETQQEDATALALMVETSTSEGFKLPLLYRFAFSGYGVETPSVEWSQDNNLGVICSKGVYLLVPEVSAKTRESPTSCLSLHKSFIPNAPKKKDNGVKMPSKKKIDGWSQSDQHLKVLDRVLTPESPFEESYRGYRLLKWAPLKRPYGGLFALLTFDFRLFLYIKQTSKWMVISDISNLLQQHFQQKFGDKAEEANSVTDLRAQLYRLAVTSMTWTPSIEVEAGLEASLLVCGSKDGYLTFWYVMFDGHSNKIEVTLRGAWDSMLGQINCLSSFDYMLLIGTSRGQVLAINLEVESEKMLYTKNMTKKLFVLQEVDDLPVSHVVGQEVKEDVFQVVFTKSNFILSYTVQVRNRAKFDLEVTHRRHKQSIYQMSATGICSLPDSKILISSSDGRVIEVDPNGESLEQREIVFEDISQTNHSVCGVASSPNGVIITILQAMATYFDHLIVKEPTQIIMFAKLSFESLKDELNHLVTDPQYGEKSIEEMWDYFLCLRGYFDKGQFYIPSQLRQFSPTTVPTDSGHSLTYHVNLKALRQIGLAVMTKGLAKISESEVKVIESAVEVIEDKLLQIHVENVISKCDNQMLDEVQCCSLYNMCRWYENKFGVKYQIEVQFSSELCPVCSEPIEFENKVYGICSNGHMFGRCSSSLIICDLVQHKYIVCKYCSRFQYIAPSIWSQTSECIFC